MDKDFTNFVNRNRLSIFGVYICKWAISDNKVSEAFQKRFDTNGTSLTWEQKLAVFSLH